MNDAAPTPPQHALSLLARLSRPLVRLLIKPALHAPTIAEKRRRTERLGRLIRMPLPRGTEILDGELAGVAMEWISNAGAADAGVMLYLHGGAYVLGSPRTHRDLTVNLARRCGLRVAALDYRLAPEHPFPAAVDDALAAYGALLTQNISPAKIFIAGDSAGGGLALACALHARSAGLPMPAGLVLFSPWLDLGLSGNSMTGKAAGEITLSAELLRASAAEYLQGRPATHPLASPLFADLRGLPPLLIQVSDTEILYDDSRRLAEAARAQGVAATLETWPGLWHVWQLMAGLLPEARRALESVANFTRGAA